ncbi:MAG: hypothetical protein LBM13_05595 [Candidatus Ancillula sp.]|nr:hypothetical protein [Candidatus Ancillula sp.]
MDKILLKEVIKKTLLTIVAAAMAFTMIMYTNGAFLPTKAHASEDFSYDTDYSDSKVSLQKMPYLTAKEWQSCPSQITDDNAEVSSSSLVKCNQKDSRIVIYKQTANGEEIIPNCTFDEVGCVNKETNNPSTARPNPNSEELNTYSGYEGYPVTATVQDNNSSVVNPVLDIHVIGQRTDKALGESDQLYPKGKDGNPNQLKIQNYANCPLVADSSTKNARGAKLDEDNIPEGVKCRVMSKYMAPTYTETAYHGVGNLNAGDVVIGYGEYNAQTEHYDLKYRKLDSKMQNLQMTPSEKTIVTLEQKIATSTDKKLSKLLDMDTYHVDYADDDTSNVNPIFGEKIDTNLKYFWEYIRNQDTQAASLADFLSTLLNSAKETDGCANLESDDDKTSPTNDNCLMGNPYQDIKGTPFGDFKTHKIYESTRNLVIDIVTAVIGVISAILMCIPGGQAFAIAAQVAFVASIGLGVGLNFAKDNRMNEQLSDELGGIVQDLSDQEQGIIGAIGELNKNLTTQRLNTYLGNVITEMRKQEKGYTDLVSGNIKEQQDTVNSILQYFQKNNINDAVSEAVSADDYAEAYITNADLKTNIKAIVDKMNGIYEYGKPFDPELSKDYNEGNVKDFTGTSDNATTYPKHVLEMIQLMNGTSNLTSNPISGLSAFDANEAIASYKYNWNFQTWNDRRNIDSAMFVDVENDFENVFGAMTNNKSQYDVTKIIDDRDQLGIYYDDLSCAEAGNSGCRLSGLLYKTGDDGKMVADHDKIWSRTGIANVRVKVINANTQALISNFMDFTSNYVSAMDKINDEETLAKKHIFYNYRIQQYTGFEDLQSLCSDINNGESNAAIQSNADGKCDYIDGKGNYNLATTNREVQTTFPSRIHLPFGDFHAKLDGIEAHDVPSGTKGGFEDRFYAQAHKIQYSSVNSGKPVDKFALTDYGQDNMVLDDFIVRENKIEDFANFITTPTSKDDLAECPIQDDCKINFADWSGMNTNDKIMMVGQSHYRVENKNETNDIKTSGDKTYHITDTDTSFYVNTLSINKENILNSKWHKDDKLHMEYGDISDDEVAKEHTFTHFNYELAKIHTSAQYTNVFHQGNTPYMVHSASIIAGFTNADKIFVPVAYSTDYVDNQVYNSNLESGNYQVKLQFDQDKFTHKLGQSFTGSTGYSLLLENKKDGNVVNNLSQYSSDSGIVSFKVNSDEKYCKMSYRDSKNIFFNFGGVVSNDGVSCSVSVMMNGVEVAQKNITVQDIFEASLSMDDQSENSVDVTTQLVQMNGGKGSFMDIKACDARFTYYINDTKLNCKQKANNNQAILEMEDGDSIPFGALTVKYSSDGGDIVSDLVKFGVNSIDLLDYAKDNVPSDIKNSGFHIYCSDAVTDDKNPKELVFYNQVSHCSVVKDEFKSSKHYTLMLMTPFVSFVDQEKGDQGSVLQIDSESRQGNIFNFDMKFDNTLGSDQIQPLSFDLAVDGGNSVFDSSIDFRYDSSANIQNRVLDKVTCDNQSKTDSDKRTCVAKIDVNKTKFSDFVVTTPKDVKVLDVDSHEFTSKAASDGKNNVNILNFANGVPNEVSFILEGNAKKTVGYSIEVYLTNESDTSAGESNKLSTSVSNSFVRENDDVELTYDQYYQAYSKACSEGDSTGTDDLYDYGCTLFEEGDVTDRLDLEAQYLWSMMYTVDPSDAKFIGEVVPVVASKIINDNILESSYTDYPVRPLLSYILLTQSKYLPFDMEKKLVMKLVAYYNQDNPNDKLSIGNFDWKSNQFDMSSSTDISGDYNKLFSYALNQASDESELNKDADYSSSIMNHVFTYLNSQSNIFDNNNK